MAKKNTAIQGKKNSGTNLVTTVSLFASIQTNKKTTAIAPALTIIKTIPANPKSMESKKKPSMAERLVTKTTDTNGEPE